MSDYESQSGKIKLIEPQENETRHDLLKRLWVTVHGKDEADFDEDDFFNEFYEDYIKVGDEIWEILEYEDEPDDADMFCKLSKNEDGSYTFFTRYYNGGTCMTEMIADAIEELKP